MIGYVTTSKRERGSEGEKKEERGCLLLCLRLGFKEITERKKEILRQMQRTVKRKMLRDKWLN
jgi:hypothetical protein